MRILVAAMGNLLCADDGFGVAVAEALAARTLPPDVTVIEVGIGGIHLVQELLSGYDALLVVDAVDRGALPGTLFVLDPHIPSAESVSGDERADLLADTHYTVPSRALFLAKALGVLPGFVRIVGCQGASVDLGLELSAPVRQSVDRAVHRIEAILAELGRDGREG